ncbi:srs domain-containing protein [Cystoisospora suis]|uniref:Srs domain-containing protein n=1 Tax=Cystoisospora suis TaxID=483139 RepID=A0A2C6KHW6_9APIC|nr:srs domain-containing protein [Cystoisospora suis]
MDSRQFSHSHGGLLRWPGRNLAWKLSWNLVLFSCIGVILAPTLGHALRHKGKNSLASATTPLADANGKEHTFTCPGAAEQASGSPTELSGTLSEAVPKLLLECAEGTTVVPTKLTEGLVCPADLPSKDLTKCKDTGAAARDDEKQAVSLSELMGGASSPAVKWEKQSTESTNRKTVYTLSLPAAPLPLVDSSFVTGCQGQPSQPKQQCVATVTVEARKSAANGQTVYCAYGKNSNDPTKRPTVTMTTKDNKMTLVCGNKEKTVVQPKNYTTHYCSDEKVSDTCTTTAGEYKSFITDFQDTWWTKDEATNSVTLTIPPEHFPASAKTIHLGCQYSPPPVAGDNQKAGAGPTACVVDVVISAKDSAGRTVAVLPAVTVGGIALAVSLAVWF